MTESRIVTAQGSGAWGGKNYQVRLFTSSKTYSDAARRTMKTVVRFAVAFESSSWSDSRWFNSEKARRSFLDESFSDLVFREIPASERQPQEVASPLQNIKGEYLSSVTFVMDYLQLDFSGYGFNMYSWPFVTVSGKTLSDKDPEYKNALCGFIGQVVEQVDEYLDKGLTLRFADEFCINLPLKVAPDFSSPEVATFNGPKKELLMAWQVGDEPFD